MVARPIIQPIKAAARDTACMAMRAIVARPSSRAALNVVYEKLGPAQRARFHKTFAKIFRGDHPRPAEKGFWTVRFAGKEIRVPLNPERLWLDWDTAVSILGHDLEIKESYAALLNSPERPDLFVDVGANYGTHSLIFLVQGIETITFEPNGLCHEYFREACDLNGVKPQLEAVALGEADGVVELHYPERETWLGSTIANLEPGGVRNSRRVEQRTLDEYRPMLNRYRRILLKIDTEGSEEGVLKGGATVIGQLRPLIVFEALPNARARAALFELLSALGYDIAALPWTPKQPVQSLDIGSFSGAAATNFMARPRS